MYRRTWTSWEVGCLLVAIPVALPILVTLSELLFGDRSIWLHLWDTVLFDYLSNTLLLMLIVGVLATLIGVSTAWLTSQYQFPMSRWFPVLLVLPLAAPSYVVGYVYADFLDYSGPLQTSLRAMGIDQQLPSIRSLAGAGLVISLVLYPYIYLLTRVSFQQQSAGYLQAARSLGANQWKVMMQVSIPLARPAIIGGLALVLMETLADYGVVEHYGVPTFTTGIFRTWFAMGEPGGALQLAACLFIIAAVLISFEQLSRRGSTANLISSSTPQEPARLYGVKSWAATMFCLLPVTLGFFIPFAVLIQYSIESGDSLFASKLLDLVGNTLTVALTAALVCLIAAIWLAYAARQRPNPITQVGIRISTLGYAIPGMVLAVGLLKPLATVDRQIAGFVLEQFETNIGLLMTGSITALVLVYTARFLTVSFNNIHSGLSQVHTRLDEVAATLGSGRLKTLRKLHLPLLRPALASALLLVFIDVVKELPATLVLRPFNYETLATRVYRLASDERLAEASTAAIMIVLLGLIPTALLILKPHKS